jgi:hypothetical protein
MIKVLHEFRSDYRLQEVLAAAGASHDSDDAAVL